MDWPAYTSLKVQISTRADDLRVHTAAHRSKSKEWSAELADLDLALAKVSERMGEASLLESREEGNLLMAESVLRRIQVYFDEIAELQSQLAEVDLRKNESAALLMLSAKLETLTVWLNYALKVPPDDLLCLPQSHPRWAKLKLIAVHLRPEEPEALAHGIKAMEDSVLYANAVIHRGFQFSHPITKNVAIGASVLLYKLNPDLVRAQAMLNYARPSIESTLALWNATDSSLMAPLLERGQPHIPFQKLIYLPRTAEPVCEYVVGNHKLGPGEDPNLSLKPDAHRVPVRLVSPFKLPVFKRKPHGSWFSCCTSRDIDDISPPVSVERLIIHVHAGGFIAMTSRSHQNYIRLWAITTQTPILCVDYRLAPEFPFPAALDDVWQTYMWVVEYADKYLGINPAKIVLTGDSAGGNLAMGCVIKAIEKGVRLPDGLLLNFPALNMWKEAYTPSFLLSLDDVIMHHTFLKLCHDCYIRDSLLDTRENHYLSPLFASASVLRQFPPTRIMVGSRDPLLDDCWRLLEQLNEAGVDAALEVFEGLVHGGMNSSIRNGVKDGIRMVERCGALLDALLGKMA